MGVGHAKLLRGADLESIEGIDSSGNVLLPSLSPHGLFLHQKCLELHEKVEGGSLEQQTGSSRFGFVVHGSVPLSSQSSECIIYSFV